MLFIRRSCSGIYTDYNEQYIEMTNKQNIINLQQVASGDIFVRENIRKYYMMLINEKNSEISLE